MPIQYFEKKGSAEGFTDEDQGNSTHEILIGIVGTDDPIEVDNIIFNVAPLLWDTGDGSTFLTRQNWRRTHHGGGCWDVRVLYGQKQTLKFEFDTTGGTVHISQSKETRESKAIDATGNLDVPPDYRQAIGVSKDRVEGTDIVSPQFNFTVTKMVNKKEVNPDFAMVIRDLTGTTNQGEFFFTIDGLAMFFEEGEVLFMGGSGSVQGVEWVFPLKFAWSKNNLVQAGVAGSGIRLGTEPITLPATEEDAFSKPGWDYFWVSYWEVPQGSTDIIPQFRAGFVERVYDPGDFNTLEISP